MAEEKRYERILKMDNRERLLTGWHGFDWNWWIFSISFSISSLGEINNPKWLGLLLCKFKKHSYFASVWNPDGRIYKWQCTKCNNLITKTDL